MRWILAVFVLLGVLIGSGYATYALAGLEGSRSQETMIEALKALDKDQDEKARKLVAELDDPLAAKLYQWMRYQRSDFLKDADEAAFGRMVQFIRGNPDWPGLYGMRKQIEKYMPYDFAPDMIVAWFDDYSPLTARGTDLYLQAMLDTGQKAKMRVFLLDWWANTPLSRDDQIYLFQKYGFHMGEAAHKKRLDMLLFGRQYSNARAVARVLGRDYRALVEARIALAEDKHGVNKLIGQVPRPLLSDAGLQYERLRWRRRHDLDMRAMEILQAPIDLTKVHNKAAWWRERHILIRRLLEKGQYESAYLLASNHMQTEGLPFAQAEWLAGWLSLRFLNEPRRAFNHFEVLYKGVSSPISKARAAYWGGRAARALGREDVAAPWLEAAARYQITFYGQLAAKELSMEGSSLAPKPPPVLTTKDVREFESSELVQAIKLFHDAGMREESKDFLAAYSDTLESAKEYRFAAELAADIRFYRDGIEIAKDASRNGLFLTAQSYPVITDKLQDIDLEWALVHALIRQESAFDFRAKSRVGAAGLMQLMPATAKEIARRAGISHRTDWLYKRPDHNIRLGTLYLEKLLDRFDGYYPMAIAAYNAGPNRVDKWIEMFGDPRKGEIDLIDWIELLPIYETRNYIQRVMEATYVYRLRLKGRQPQLSSLAPLHTNI